MSDWYFALAGLFLLTIAIGLIRVLRGPTPADSMIAAQLFATTGVATLLLLGTAQQAPALYDVALIFVLLAALTTVAFVIYSWPQQSTTAEGQHDTQ